MAQHMIDARVTVLSFRIFVLDMLGAELLSKSVATLTHAQD